MNRVLLTVLLLLAGVIWGWSFSVVKDAVAVYGVVSFLAIRFAIGSVFLSVFAVRRLAKNSLLPGGMIGIVLASGYLFQTFGLRYTTATNSGLITGLFVVFALLANRIFFGVRGRPVFWFAVGISIVGLCLLTGASPNRPTFGDLLTLGAAVCFGLQVALLDRYARNCDAMVLTLYQTVSALFMFLLAWPLAEPFIWPTREVWFALAVTGVLATAVGFYIQVLAQQQLPAVRVAIILNLEPVFAVCFGYMLAGDRLTLIQIVGAVLMVVAVMISEVIPTFKRDNVGMT